jgi:hypothetical protein
MSLASVETVKMQRLSVDGRGIYHELREIEASR